MNFSPLSHVTFYEFSEHITNETSMLEKFQEGS